MKAFVVLASAAGVAFALFAAPPRGAARVSGPALRRGSVVRTAKAAEYVPVDYEAENRKLQEERLELEREMLSMPAALEELKPEGELLALAAKYRLRVLVQHGDHEYESFSGLWYSPHAPREKALPLLVYVPGTGEIGTNLVRQFNQRGLFDKVLSREFQQRHPCHLLAVSPPKCITSFFGSLKWEPNPQQRSLVNFIDGARRFATGSAVDTNRIYMTGLSYGGSAVASTAANYPGRFAAVVPVSGGLPPEDRIHPQHPGNWWCFYNGKMPSGGPDGTNSFLRIFQSAVNDAGGDCRIATFPKSGHNAWDNAWREDAMWGWMFSKSLSAGKPVSRMAVSSRKASDGRRTVSVDSAVCTASKAGVDAGHGPERVVDGLADTYYKPAGGMDRDDWWQVDFKRNVKGRVEINTGDRKGAMRMQGGIVETSKDGKSFVRAANVLEKTGSCAFELRQPVRYLRLRPKSSRAQELVIRELRLLQSE